MVREQVERYLQDKLGNVRRELDDHRAQAGNSGLNDNNGIADVAAGDTGTTQVVYEIPDDIQQAILQDIHIFNETANAATFHIEEATLNDDGTVDTSTRRSVTYNLSANGDRTIDYTGDPFTEDAIAVDVTEAAEVGVGVILDHHEEFEPASVQTEAP